MRWSKRICGRRRLVWALAALAAAALTRWSGLEAAAQAPPAPASSPAAQAARFVVVLDAAHGGDDLGGRLNAQAEKNFDLALSVRLRSLLAARGIQVVTTRESDAAVDLNRRAEIANHANAQACLSLHGSESGSGVHLFVSSMTPIQRSKEKDQAPGTLARFVPWKTAQAAWVTRSLALAGTLNSALLQAGTTVTLGRTALPALESMTCPAVAVEIAPERGSDQGVTADLDDPGYQARVAGALAAALLEWRTDAGRTTEVRQP